MGEKLFLIFVSFFMIAAFFIINSCKKGSSEDNTIQVASIGFVPDYFLKNGEMAG